MRPDIFIIGMGTTGRDSLSHDSLERIRTAHILFAGERYQNEFPEFTGNRYVIGSDLAGLVDTIKFAPSDCTSSHMVVLASGDPCFYGIADYLLKHLDRNRIEITPNISAMQWAFARAKLSWNDARILSCHGRDNSEIVHTASRFDKMGIFTSGGEHPSVISRLLIDRGINDLTAIICENLGSENEKVTVLPLPDVAGRVFAPLNVLLLVRNVSIPVMSDKKNIHRAVEKVEADSAFGISDSLFIHTGKMITKEEIRAVSISKLRIREDSIVWDIGSGSGSVGIEAARMARKGIVYAIEKDNDRINQIRQNIRRFGIGNMQVLLGTAPDGLSELPGADAVFIGGSGGRLDEIIDVVNDKLTSGGRIVINAVTLQTLNDAVALLTSAGYKTDVVSMNISRTREIGGLSMFEAENPVFIISGAK